mgnify:FL=1
MRYAKIKISALPNINIAHRRLVYDGWVIINEKDLSAIFSEPFEDVVATLGGTVMTAHEAKVEIKNNKYKWYNK